MVSRGVGRGDVWESQSVRKADPRADSRWDVSVDHAVWGEEASGRGRVGGKRRTGQWEVNGRARDPDAVRQGTISGSAGALRRITPVGPGAANLGSDPHPLGRAFPTDPALLSACPHRLACLRATHRQSARARGAFEIPVAMVRFVLVVVCQRQWITIPEKTQCRPSLLNRMSIPIS